MKLTLDARSIPTQVIPNTVQRLYAARRAVYEMLLGFYTKIAPLAAVLTIVLLATLTNLGGWFVIGTAVFAGILLARSGANARVILLKVMSLAVGVSALNYSVWRFQVVNWDAWWISVPLVLAELFGILHTLGFQYTVWPRQEIKFSYDEDPTRRPVFVFIPTVNEGVSVLTRTIEGALKAREAYLAAHPHGQVTIVLCNDGWVANAPDWEKTEQLAERYGIVCVTRTVKGGAKAGNIENARRRVGATGEALVVIFDADQVAKPEFLLRTVPEFADSRMGWVQTGQYYRNVENPVAHWANDQQALFYQVLCPGKSNQNAAFICGTNVVIRAAALDEIGGLPQDIVTEDFAGSVLLHDRWRSVFLPGELATGLGPMTLQSYFRQQNRWAVGTMTVLKLYWRRIFLPWGSRLTLPQRIQYALACTHYMSGVRDLIYILSPVTFIFTGIAAVKGATLDAFLAHFLPYGISALAAFWYVARGKSSFRGVLMGLASFYTLLGSLLTVIAGKRIGFAITSKTRGADKPWPALWPHLLALALSLAAFIIGISRQVAPEEQGKILVSLVWIGYTMALLGGVFWLGYAESRSAAQPAAARSGRVRVSRSRAWLGKNRVLVTAPAIAVLFLCGLAFFAPHLAGVSAAEAPRFSVRTTGEPRLLGLTPTSETLLSEPDRLAGVLRVTPSIIGRAQEISDPFDSDWAKKLAAQGKRPYITLILHARNTPAYTQSLPGITNGVYDEELKQWARSIREYGQPVYLTILPHVDRNYALTSAVANGGIPQDVSRAWLHVRQVFAEAGADNVAWVWAPADPIHDQVFAPPASSIDVTLISLISYPQTNWADPQQVLHDLVARYPDMPLFVEVSASGPPAEKAAWLARVGAAAGSIPNLRALFYHEGSPDGPATPAQHQAWSVDSDAQSLEASNQMLTLARLGTLHAAASLNGH